MAAQKVGMNTLLDFVGKGVEFPHVAWSHGKIPCRLKRFMTAYVEGIRCFKTRKEEGVRKMMVLSRLIDREIAEKAFDVYTRSLPDDGRPTINGLEAVLADFIREAEGQRFDGDANRRPELSAAMTRFNRGV